VLECSVVEREGDKEGKEGEGANALALNTDVEKDDKNGEGVEIVWRGGAQIGSENPPNSGHTPPGVVTDDEGEDEDEDNSPHASGWEESCAAGDHKAEPPKKREERGVGARRLSLPRRNGSVLSTDSEGSRCGASACPTRLSVVLS
jgi:hypothetical protein